MCVHFPLAVEFPDQQRLAVLRCLFDSLTLLSQTAPRTLLILVLSCPECTAKVKYTDKLTTSPDLDRDTFQLPLQTSPSHHTDNETDNDGGHHSPSHQVPPRSFSDIPRPGRRTSAQSFRRRMTYGGRAASISGSVATQHNPNGSSLTVLQRARSTLSTLLVPGHKVGKPPGFMHELKTILFGSCASYCLICARAHIIV